MDEKYYVLVVGKGQTSRANVDALMEDYYYAKGANGTLVLAFEGRPSDGQVYAAQLAKDKSIDILVWNTTVDAPGLPACSVTQSPNPIYDAIDHFDGDNCAVFFLFDDNSQEALAYCGEKVPAYDLTEGLKRLSPTPKVEQEVTHSPTTEELEEIFAEPEETEEEDSDLESKVRQLVTTRLLSLVDTLTEDVLWLLCTPNSPSKGE